MWESEEEKLREIFLKCGLVEERKWGKPCFESDGKNIVLIQKMKTFVAVLFFNGSLLKDPDGLLEAPGENSRIARRMRFATPHEVAAQADIIAAYVREAVAVARSGRTVPKVEGPPQVVELERRLATDPELKAAFDALTPGRQRGYGIYFAGARQSSTREARIDRYRPKILAGKGLHDR